jgi:hypothetical protein
MTTTPSQGVSVTPRRRAAIIGVGLDGPLQPHRLITGDDRLVIGGSEQTRAALLETILRLDSELERMGVELGELDPEELAELALRIDSPELHRVALRLHDGLQERGRSFEESSAEELTELATGDAKPTR